MHIMNRTVIAIEVVTFIIVDKSIKNMVELIRVSALNFNLLGGKINSATTDEIEIYSAATAVSYLTFWFKVNV